MPDSKLIRKIVLLHVVILPALVLTIKFFATSHKTWDGVDDAVVEKIAREHGRSAKPPIIDPGSGDLLLFVFLAAGAAGGFLAGYYWRELVKRG